MEAAQHLFTRKRAVRKDQVRLHLEQLSSVFLFSLAAVISKTGSYKVVCSLVQPAQLL